MNRTQARVLLAAALLGGMVVSGTARAQATLKPDGQWRHALGLGLSYASGNSESTTLTLNADGVRQTEYDKWTYYGKALRAESDDETTGDQIGLGTRYERDINARVFGFGQADYLRDRPANLSRRTSVGGGFGYHVFKTDRLTWDVFSGVGYTHDRYIEPTDVGGATRGTWGYAELLFGEESNHKISDTANFRQRFVIYPNMSESGEFRAQLDAGLSVSINDRMSLTATLTYRYNSDPGAGFEKDDVLFVTGISAKIE
jgi:putative salt-induced outer membrane protein